MAFTEVKVEEMKDENDGLRRKVKRQDERQFKLLKFN